MSEKRSLVSRLLNAARCELDAWMSAFVRFMPGRIGIRVRRQTLKFRLKGIGRQLICHDGVLISGHANITIGSGVYFMRNMSLFADSGTVLIGNDVAIGPESYLAANDGGEIVIGDDTLIAHRVSLRTSNHAYRDPEKPIRQQGHVSGNIIIGRDVWIGAHVVILPNVTIGDHAIVGAGAVVTRDVPEWAIAGGVPARVIGDRPRAGAV